MDYSGTDTLHDYYSNPFEICYYDNSYNIKHDELEYMKSGWDIHRKIKLPKYQVINQYLTVKRIRSPGNCILPISTKKPAHHWFLFFYPGV